MASPRPKIPPLCPGDRLTRGEFERRYAAMPEHGKAELIEGVVYMPPRPVRFRHHGGQHAVLATWLGRYQVFTTGVLAATNSTVRLDLDNEPQPDNCMLIDPARGGQARIDDDDYIVGAPELNAEIAASSVSYDLHIKLNAYRRNGVQEYIVWRVDAAIDWFVLRDGSYVQLQPGSDGIFRSEVFPGLWLDAAALLRGDLVRVHHVLQQGLASPEHAAFVARLSRPIAQ